jgi:hypothetical protein
LREKAYPLRIDAFKEYKKLGFDPFKKHEEALEALLYTPRPIQQKEEVKELLKIARSLLRKIKTCRAAWRRQDTAED